MSLISLFFHGVCRLQVVFTACVAFRLFSRRFSPLGCFYGVCGLPVSRFWRVSLSLVSWCLSYFALDFVFIACVAFKLFHGVCRLQVVFTACVAFGLFSRPVSPSSWPFLACVAYKLFSWRVLPSGCFHGVCRLQGVFSAFAAFSLFLRRVSPSG